MDSPEGLKICLSVQTNECRLEVNDVTRKTLKPEAIFDFCSMKGQRGDRHEEYFIMSEIGKYKLSDAVPKPDSEMEKSGNKKTEETGIDAEQVREAHESEDAKNASTSNRDRMVDIGRGNQQAGRQGS